MPSSRLALTLAALLAFAGAAPSAHAGDVSISITTPSFGVAYTQVHGHHVGQAHVARPVVRRVCPPRRVVVRRAFVPPRPVRCAPRVVRRVVHPVHHVPHHPHGHVTAKTKHVVKHGKKKTKIVTKHETVYHR